MKLLFVFALFSCYSSHNFSQNLISFERQITYSFHGYTSIGQAVILPQDIPHRQQVVHHEFSMEPDSIFEKDGNQYAWFVFKNVKRVDTVTISVNTILVQHQYDLFNARRKAQKPEPLENPEKYLAHEYFIQTESSKVQKIAKSISGSTREETVKAIVDFVTDNLEYKNYINEYRGAKLALTQGKGDCTEYSELMIALCRAKGVPSRIVMGSVTDRERRRNSLHNWVEVWFDEYGWVPFDPTWADSESPNMTWEKMLNTYVYFTQTRDYEGWSPAWDQYRPSVRYEYFSRNLLKEKEATIKGLMKNKHYERAHKSIDTLIISGFKNYKYHNWKAKMYIAQNDLKNAIPSLQSATALATEDFAKTEVFAQWAAFYAQKGEIEKGLRFLEKAMETSQFWNKEMLFEDPVLEPLRGHPKFKEITKEKWELVNKYTGDELLKPIHPDNYQWLVQKKDELSFNSGHLFYIMLDDRMKELKIKTMESYEDGKLTTVNEFMPNGQLKKRWAKYGNYVYVKEVFYEEDPYSMKLSDPEDFNMIRIVDTQYDAFEEISSQKTSVLLFARDYLSGIRHTVKRKNQEPETVRYSIWRDATDPKHITIPDSINELAVLPLDTKWNERRYWFSEDNRLMRFLRYKNYGSKLNRGTDSLSVDYIGEKIEISYNYEADSLSYTKVLHSGGFVNESRVVKYNDLGKIILDRAYAMTNEYFYNDEGQIEKYTRSNNNKFQETTIYKYKKGLPVKIITAAPYLGDKKREIILKYKFYK